MLINWIFFLVYMSIIYFHLLIHNKYSRLKKQYDVYALNFYIKIILIREPSLLTYYTGATTYVTTSLYLPTPAILY